MLFISLLSAAYFYLEGSKRSCFIEDVPSETNIFGHFKSELSTGGSFIEDASVKLKVAISESPSGHVVKNMALSSKGKWSYTSSYSGPHQICISYPDGENFGNSRIHFDITIGEDFDPITNVADTLSDRIKDIDRLVQNALRDARFQRTKEAEFRDQSEKTHTKISNWTFIQMIILGLTCVWQMRTLKNFFTAKKLL
eukprot:NODE_15_length_50561_cov_0.608081.p27 type:complete len:197 gc:universal NODE_15_length_50561_cov_0.608081:19650-20240(+)